MSKHQMIILTPRRRGRPRAMEPGSRVTTWIPERYHDALIRIANEKDISVSAVVGNVLTQALELRAKRGDFSY